MVHDHGQVLERLILPWRWQDLAHGVPIK